MPFAVATFALITAELLALPAGPADHGVRSGQVAPRAPRQPLIAAAPAAEADRAAARYRLLPPDAPSGSTDLALYVGQREHGAQFEFGALGGGRSDAPGLVHVGIGWDF